MYNLLIVEDESPLQQALETKLTKEGFTVVTAGNGQEALDKIKAQKPDLIVLDILMPRMDGKKFLKELRGNPEWTDIPVIVLTNLSSEDDKQEILQYRTARYLIKSDSGISDLIDEIKQVLSA